jgi:hypothetical protein
MLFVTAVILNLRGLRITCHKTNLQIISQDSVPHPAKDFRPLNLYNRTQSVRYMKVLIKLLKKFVGYGVTSRIRTRLQVIISDKSFVQGDCI